MSPPPSGNEGPGLLRAAFRRHAAGVAVISARGPGGPVGFTATSVASVSADPPMLSFGIGTGASSWPVIAAVDRVAVHILGEEQRDLAVRFAASGADRFAPPTSWRPGPGGLPLLDGVLAVLVCRVTARVPAGDHRVVVAEILSGSAAGAGRPLVYHDGAYTTLHRDSSGE